MKLTTSISFFLIILLNSYTAIADFPDIIKERYAPAVIKPYSIYIDAPSIAELNIEVPISIKSLQLPDNKTYVTEVSFYSHLKPDTPIMSYSLSANTLADGIKSRIKMAMGNNIIYAVARLSDGSVIGGETITKATYACSGGG